MTTRTITVGSSPLCTLHIRDDPYVSLRHAEISETPRGFTVRDLGTTNGTFVVRPDGQVVAIKWNVVLLGLGDRVRVGRTVLPWVADREA